MEAPRPCRVAGHWQDDSFEWRAWKARAEQGSAGALAPGQWCGGIRSEQQALQTIEGRGENTRFSHGSL